ncbi:MAG: ATP-binding protein [Sutterellaceae bacterium]|nr:ATP-binding protein [Sutterellaceae bacterium]MDD7441474.1 ATP-binding protein [Sutterellaceae bacterium]MDY2868091.1 ATP-binding protein [Mesosutterella sp.]
MRFIPRDLSVSAPGLAPPRAIVLFGPRRVGKATLLRELTRRESVRWYDGDNLADADALQLYSSGDVMAVLAEARTIVIDEAQQVPNIALTLKRLVDANETLGKPVRIFATCSSSLDLAKGVRESAVGRLVKRELWPLSVSELAGRKGWGWVRENLGRLMVYGTYPIAVAQPEIAREFLRVWCDGVLFKDILTLPGIRRGRRFDALVRLLAKSVGSEVSYEALSRETGLNKATVADYIKLLEQCFIVRVCPSYSKSLPNELKKGKKIYFCDTGIRNAVIGDFSPISSRPDAEAIWENFFYMERVKLHSALRDFTNVFFWRTTGARQASLDFVEVRDGAMQAFDCSLDPKGGARPDDAFRAAYPDCGIVVATPADLQKIFGNARQGPP